MNNKPMPKSVHIIMTGGTIDSHYDGTLDTVTPNESSVLPRFIKNLKLYTNCEFTQVCMKDSRQLTREDIQNVLNTADKSPHKHILIAHGTYTMPDSARFLEANMKSEDKVVVFTGSMIPLVDFTFSDAGFNLGYAFGQIGTLEPGVYLAMNGKIFAAVEVTKLISEGRFVSIFGEK